MVVSVCMDLELEGFAVRPAKHLETQLRNPGMALGDSMKS